MADLLQLLLSKCVELDEELVNMDKGDKQRQDRIRNHLQIVDTELCYRIPDFEKDLQWMNTSESLSLYENLKGNIVILDFFTYCCINCVHVLPDLEAVESKYSFQDGVVVLGVHSAKFENEKVSANILSAILRYNIHHPVVNDHDGILWHKLQISCWPTFVVIGPDGQFLRTFVGEGHRQNLIEFIDVTLEHYRTKINQCQVVITLEKNKINETPLQFPGKIASSTDGKTLVVSDTGHHRILVLSITGVVQHCIGGKNRAFKDGSFTDARFNSPQGVAINFNIIYVADTDNHALREINLTSKTVRTLAGTGYQGQDKEGGQFGTNQVLSSPWDIVLGRSQDSETDNLLFIAMAGLHQIWVYFIQDGNWLQGSVYTAGTCLRFSGSGQEENRNNSYPTKAGFAQPSGLALSQSLGLLFVADSESSTVRKVSLQNGGVKALVGGEFDPMNLFAYGDTDGKGYNCKLQHPLGVAMVTEDGPLLVADSYNHKIKSVDIKTTVCTTIVGPEPSEGIICNRLNEPSGLCVSGNIVYIADTNNHTIKILDLTMRSVQNLPVIFTKDPVDMIDGKSKPAINLRGHIENLQDLVVPYTGKLEFILEVILPEGSHLTNDVPSTWTIYSESATELIELARKEIRTIQNPESVTIDVIENKSLFYFQCKVLHCGEDNLCKMSQRTYKQVIKIDPLTSTIDRTCKICFTI